MNRFKEMDNTTLVEWIHQYGDRNSGLYPEAAGQRRKAYAEARTRGIDTRSRQPHYPRPKGYGPNGNEYMKNWGLGGEA